MRKLSLLWALLVSALFVVGCGPETPDIKGIFLFYRQGRRFLYD